MAEDGSPTWAGRIRTVLAGSPRAPLVLLGNFEVENAWAKGEPGLPRIAVGATTEIVNRMDQFALLLGCGADHVVLKSQPDPDHLSHLAELGFDLPRVLCPSAQDPHHTVTEDVLADPGLLRVLSGLAGTAALWPHGISEREEAVAERTGLRLAGPSARICKAVNGKAYSRRLTEDLGLRRPRGRVCSTVDELLRATVRAQEGEWRPLVLKDSYGVSGKGLLIAHDPATLTRACRMIARRAERSGDDRLDVVLEEWVAKKADLNYQFTLGRDGAVRFDFVREAVTEDGVHQGHRVPARLDEARTGELREVSQRIGERLHDDGYFGVVGVDAMVAPDDGIYPVVEINARNNMSTYQQGVIERFVPAGGVAQAGHYPVTLREFLPYSTCRELLKGLVLEPGGSEGLIVTNYATVNAAQHRLRDSDRGDRTGRTSFDGRLYGITVANGADRLRELTAELAARITAFSKGNRDER
ncbi:ATP-grasp domain-containing protein [Kitasatospora sp. NPDC057542]|uniref:preATP grasp domain-containing protein n=1 Tax=Streptomycetaceae TaxID=2062 RepID=UPI001CCD2BEE|nr:ATP-grasp domain-containing protein [Streptomyces sp. LS1784]